MGKSSIAGHIKLRRALKEHVAYGTVDGRRMNARQFGVYVYLLLLQKGDGTVSFTHKQLCADLQMSTGALHRVITHLRVNGYLAGTPSRAHGASTYHVNNADIWHKKRRLSSIRETQSSIRETQSSIRETQSSIRETQSFHNGTEGAANADQQRDTEPLIRYIEDNRREYACTHARDPLSRIVQTHREIFHAANSTYPARLTGQIERDVLALAKEHGIDSVVERLQNFAEHYKAKSWFADSLTWRNILKHYDEAATLPRKQNDPRERVAKPRSKNVQWVGDRWYCQDCKLDTHPSNGHCRCTYEH